MSGICRILESGYLAAETRFHEFLSSPNWLYGPDEFPHWKMPLKTHYSLEQKADSDSQDFLCLSTDNCEVGGNGLIGGMRCPPH